MLQAQAKIQINKPIEVVWDAIIDPKHMSQYFISEGSNHMIKGTTVFWAFPEFPDKYPVHIHDTIPHTFLSFAWNEDVANQIVEITLTTFQQTQTIVEIVEKEMPNTPEGIQNMSHQTEGWANFLACLKAYLEYGINLRKHAFDFMTP